MSQAMLLGSARVSDLEERPHDGQRVFSRAATVGASHNSTN